MTIELILAVVITALLILITYEITLQAPADNPNLTLAVAAAGAAIIYVTFAAKGHVKRIAGGSALNFDDITDIPVAEEPYPYYSDMVSRNEVIKRSQKLKSALRVIKESRDPYKLISVISKAGVVGNTLDGKPLKFISTWEDTKDYDNLALYFTEKQLLQCSTGYYRSLQHNFSYFGKYLYDKLSAKGRKPTTSEFRDIIFENIKSCHNFRCTLAAKVYDYFKAGSVLDFSAGWGDRLFAACSLGVKYVGIDPNAALREPYKEIVAAVGSKQEVLTSGSEYLPHAELEKAMSKQKIDKFDMIFTSPPYFDYEIYSKGPQSYNTLTNTFEKWLVYFLFYTLAKYAQYIKPDGRLVLYIQDVGGNAYIEPIILFITSWFDHFQLEYEGIFSSNKFPFIAFKKVPGASPNHNSGALENHYPKIYALASKLQNIGVNHIYFEVEPNIKENKTTGNIEIFDDAPNTSSLDRALYKLLLSLESTNIVWYGTRNASERLTRMNDYCKFMGKQLTYCVAKNELSKTNGNIGKTKLSEHITQASENGMILKEYAGGNASMDTLKFLEGEVLGAYSDAEILPPGIFVEPHLLTESIKELLLTQSGMLDPEKYDGSVITDVQGPVDSVYFEALRDVFPNAIIEKKNGKKKYIRIYKK
jgi:16S rRNA G966 N2-methylase RsmD